jgi:uncharacterized membrane protein
VVDYPPAGSDAPPTVMAEPRRLALAAAVGVVAGGVAAALLPWQTVPLLFWLGAGLTWTAAVWLSVLPLDAVGASRYATREDPHGPTANTLLLSASVAALGAVILGILKAGNSSGADKIVLLGAGIGAIVCSWGVVHTVFTLRYAGLYYRGKDGGVSFNEDDKPVYADFAYVAFTIGMTYQVSDTDLTTKEMRHTALRHALLSYLLGTVIIAATINLAAGLAK